MAKTAVLAGLEGLLNLQLHKAEDLAEDLADFRETLVFTCKTMKTRRICSLAIIKLVKQSACTGSIVA